ncbi:zinc finger protein GIS2-like [Anopheles stephensi]|uniref:zinc finger protein GIS2-like n=1 Tax=Anopheles stephensi TaxID=30069 RepID=UPI0016587B9E|nr:zinc finger protein GIS2-like [Anopheles stephensi]
MEKIARKGPIPEEELVTIIIDNMGDASNTSAMRYSANTVKKLKSMLEKYEQLRMLKASVSSPRVHPNSQQPSAAGTGNRTSETRCFNCSAYGHFREKCPKPPRPPGFCFRCHQLDHVFKDCPDRNKTSAAVIFTTDTDGVRLQETQEEAQQASSMNRWSQDAV